MDYFRIGLIVRPHGVRGEVKLLPLTDDVSRFKRLSDAFIERAGEYRPARIINTKLTSDNSVVACVEGVSTVEAAEALRGCYLAVDRAHAVKLPEGAYFISDIIGCTVASTDGTELGVVEDVYETNANDVYVVRGEKKLSVPALKRLLASVDTENKRIIFNADVLSEVGLFED